MMKALLFFFIVTPVFACKMEPRAAKKGDETAAINAVKRSTSAKHVKARFEKGHWLVRTTKPSCIEYKIKTERQPDCKVNAEVVSERPCP